MTRPSWKTFCLRSGCQQAPADCCCRQCSLPTWQSCHPPSMLLTARLLPCSILPCHLNPSHKYDDSHQLSLRFTRAQPCGQRPLRSAGPGSSCRPVPPSTSLRSCPCLEARGCGGQPLGGRGQQDQRDRHVSAGQLAVGGQRWAVQGSRPGCSWDRTAGGRCGPAAGGRRCCSWAGGWGSRQSGWGRAGPAAGAATLRSAWPGCRPAAVCAGGSRRCGCSQAGPPAGAAPPCSSRCGPTWPGCQAACRGGSCWWVVSPCWRCSGRRGAPAPATAPWGSAPATAGRQCQQQRHLHSAACSPAGGCCHPQAGPPSACCTCTAASSQLCRAWMRSPP